MRCSLTSGAQHGLWRHLGAGMMMRRGAQHNCKGSFAIYIGVISGGIFTGRAVPIAKHLRKISAYVSSILYRDIDIDIILLTFDKKYSSRNWVVKFTRIAVVCVSPAQLYLCTEPGCRHAVHTQ